MAARRMTIILSPLINTKTDSLSQKVSFINVLEGAQIATSAPESVPYSAKDTNTVGLINYYPITIGTGASAINYTSDEGMSTIRNSEQMSVAIYRQEMGYDKYGNPTPVSALEPVALNQSSFHLRDFGVTNNRWYRYSVYPSNNLAPLVEIDAEVETKWNGWSITELHPTDATMTKFSVSSSDVWVFNLNVETGAQSQNIVRESQQTLGQYPRFSQGRQNFLSGTVTCLLGSQVLPADWIQRKRQAIKWDENGNPSEYKLQWYNAGGYQERLPFSSSLSSNERVDMLKAWRKLIFSHNPKLLKDRKGQAFLVTLNEASNQVNDSVALQPETISFSWTQIGTLDNAQILDTSLGGGGLN